MAHVQLNLANLVRGTGHGHKFRKRKPRSIRPVRPSRANELWYKAELLRVVKYMHNLTRTLVYPELKAAVQAAQAKDSLTRDALPRRSFESSLNKVAQRMGGIDNTAQRLADLAVQKNLGAVDERLTASIKASVSIDVAPFLTKSGPIRDAMAAATQANVELIKDLPAKYLDQIRQTVEENFVDGVRWEDLAAKLEERGGVAESRAKLIARDQTSKMNGAFNEVRQTSLGIDQYTWQTSGDERVREEHAANDGQVFRWDTPPANTGHPGDDVNCRCVAVPFFDLDAMEQETFQ